jgi:hypothetical protein
VLVNDRDAGHRRIADDAPPPRAPEIAPRARAALLLPASTRAQIARRFFARHPHGSAPLGLGRAVVDFVDWERRSGRLADDGGSRWWRCVNGVMMLDLRDAARAIEHGRSARGAVAAWVAYAGSENPGAQVRLWAAHQASIAVGLEHAARLLAAEPAAEREFAAIVVAIVERVAAGDAPTATGDLAAFTARHYPAHYPARDAEVTTLRRDLASLLASRNGQSGRR